MTKKLLHQLTKWLANCYINKHSDKQIDNDQQIDISINIVTGKL